MNENRQMVMARVTVQNKQFACAIFASYLGINTCTEKDLLALAEELLFYLPPGWHVGIGVEEHAGIPYFYNSATGESDWKHPLEDECLRKVAQARVDLRKIKNELVWKRMKEEVDQTIDAKENEICRLHFLLHSQNEQAAQIQLKHTTRIKSQDAQYQRDLQERENLIARLTDTILTKDAHIAALQEYITELECARADPTNDPVMCVDTETVFSFPTSAPAAPSSISGKKLQQGNWEEVEWANDPVYCESLPVRSGRA